MISRLAAIVAALLFIAIPASSVAQDAPPAEPVYGEPVDGAISLQRAATPLAEEVHTFHNWILMPVMVGISLFVLALLIYVVLKFNKKANPTPSTFSHNTPVEVLWTVIPIIILLFISLFSFDLLYLTDRMPDGQVKSYEAGTKVAGFPNDFVKKRQIKRSSHLQVELVDIATGEKTLLSAADDYDVVGFGEQELIVTLVDEVPQGSEMLITGGRSRVGKKKFLDLFGEDESRIIPEPTVTIKATGFQWGWTYNYPDYGDFEFTSLIASQETVEPRLWKMATTNDVVVPAGKTVRIVTTARDVIHAWAIPAFAVKVDAIPGRLNETWFYTEREGTYYGQCSEICGIDHAYMPISVRVVSEAEFQAWVNERREMDGLDPFFTEKEQLASARTDLTADLD